MCGAWCLAHVAMMVTYTCHIFLLLWSVVLKAVCFHTTSGFRSRKSAGVRARRHAVRHSAARCRRACVILFLIHSAACRPPGPFGQLEGGFQAQNGSVTSAVSGVFVPFRGGSQQPYSGIALGQVPYNSSEHVVLAYNKPRPNPSTVFHLEAHEFRVGRLTPRFKPLSECDSKYPFICVIFFPLLFVPCKGFPGEGPQDLSFSMCSVNVTSCMKNLSAVFALGAADSVAPLALCLLQETRIHPLKRNSLTNTFQRNGWSLTIGPQPPVQRIKAVNGKSTYRQGHGGLAIASRGDISVLDEAIPKEFDISHCVQSARCAGGSFSFRVINCYLPSGPKHKLERREIMSRVFNFIASKGSGPTFIGGDFNDSPEKNESISQAIQSGDFCDVVFENRAARGLETSFTFSRAKSKGTRFSHVPKSSRCTSASQMSGKSRIDFFLTNSSASQCVTKAWHAYESVFPNHVPVCLELDIPADDPKVFRLMGSPQWSFPNFPRTQQEWAIREDMVKPIIDHWIPHILPLAMDGQVDEAWNIACDATKDILNSLSTHKVSSTKGNTPKFVQVSARRPIRETSVVHTRRNKAMSLIREINKKFDAYSPQRHTQWKMMLSSTIKNLRTTWRLLGFPEHEFLITTKGEFDGACKAFDSFCSKQDHEAQITGIQNWKKRLRISNSKDKKQVYRWIKGSFSGPPKFIRLADGSVSGSIPTMLDAVSDKMEGIYNTHSETNPQHMIEHFENKYGNILNDMSLSCAVPVLTNQHFFDACQKKDVAKACGMDGWKYHDLKQLPPSGWVFFRLIVMMAEAHGKWPTPITCVSLSTIPKGDDPFLDVNNIRAIGVTSAIYSLWSSIRFSHLSGWIGQLAPASLLGGIHHRDPLHSEIQMSMDLKTCVAREEAIAVFIDRWKCFDLLIPQVSLYCARRLGLPSQIEQACLGFYSNQTKFFKIAGYYGRRVMSTNSAVQGCSMSILMINCAYAVLTQHLSSVAPQVSISTFIDDCKIWGPTSYEDQVVHAFHEVCNFDQAIGQKLNPIKSEVLGSSRAKAKRFNNKLSRPLTIKSRVKTLGRSIAMNKSRNSVHQTSRITKACLSLNKIGRLPLCSDQKAMFVQSIVHTAWIFGSEIQGPNHKSISQLRTRIADVVSPSKHKMRSPFLVLATQKDPFLDPVAKWTQHVFRILRKLGVSNPSLVSTALRWAKANRCKRFAAVNGFPQVLAFLFAELNWDIVDPSNFIIRSDNETWCLTEYSDSFFFERLGDHLRTYLIRKLPQRAEGSLEGPGIIVDSYLTRLLLDNTFSTSDEFDHLRPHLAVIPQDFTHAQNLLRTALSGKVFSGPRLYKANLRNHDHCPECAVKDCHEHIFSECPLFENTRPPNYEKLPQLTRNCGIVFRRAAPPAQAQVCLDHIAEQLPSPPIRPQDIVFTDGSCFSSKWRQARVAASAVYIPASLNFAALVPGLDQTSQRAELYAVLLALLATEGPITIASDCQNIVSGFALLQQNNFQLSKVQCLDNRDIWDSICENVNNRQARVQIMKVKAHCQEGDLQQPDHLTRGNCRADNLAKECAKRAWESDAPTRKEVFQAVVATQVHIISVLHQRFHSNSQDYMSQLDAENHIGELGNFSKSCGASGEIVVAKPEIEFVASCLRGSPSESHIREIKQLYPIFSMSLEPDPRCCQIHISVTPAELVKCQRRMKIGFAEDLVQFAADSSWYFSPSQNDSRVPWLLIFVAFCNSKAGAADWFAQCKSLHSCVCMFRSALGWIWKRSNINCLGCKQIPSLKEFGWGRISGLSGSFSFKNLVPIWFFLLNHSLIFKGLGNPPEWNNDLLHRLLFSG